jgi:CDP-diacylglycerol--glycerol-3-phosphate 3-phosphatidyltransferase
MVPANQQYLPYRRRPRYIIPSAVSVFRVLIALSIIATLTRWPSFTVLVTWIGIPLVFSLDAVDGVVARWLKVPTLLGSFIDIAADRAVEFIFLRYLISKGVIPLWFPAIFYGRILLTDACRVLAFGMQRVLATGIVLPRRLRVLVLSRASRTIYGTIKAVFFGVLLLGRHDGHTPLTPLELGLMLSVVACSMLRASPIVLTYLPRWRELTVARLLAYIHADVNDVAPRSTKIVSSLQLISDVGLATWLLVLAWR